MKLLHTVFVLGLVFSYTHQISAQVDDVFEDFEGSSNIAAWTGDDCEMSIDAPNPSTDDINPSATVLRYHDVGGQYANVRFDMDGNFDLSQNQTFSLQIYISSVGITGSQPSQISLKLQDGFIPEPWTTQSEIIKPVTMDEWQTVTFNFEDDDYRNLDPTSLPPTQRTDFNRVVLQVNGENNSDHVLAYIDNISLYAGVSNDPIFDNLVWSDEFEMDGPLDGEAWFQQSLLPAGDSWYNGEIQHYTDREENAFVEDGVLHLVAKRETFTDQGVTKQFTSARLNSKFAFTYGRVEVRAKLPTGVGTWPAIWMLGKNISEPGAYWETEGFGTTSWPACGEIDIMEHWGDNQDYVSSAIHTPSSFGGTVNYGGRNLPNASTQFHVYTMVWTEEKIEFLVDDVKHYTYNPPIKNSDTWPFDADQYILFNIAILPGIASTFTESAMEVDYIRIYQESELMTSDAESSSEHLAFPNPFHDQVVIHLGDEQGEVTDVRLYDSSGMLKEGVGYDQHATRLQVKVARDLLQGIYFLHYKQGGQSYVHRLVKSI